MKQPKGCKIGETSDQEWNEITVRPLQNVPHDFRDQHSPDRSRHTADSYHRTNSAPGEKVRGYGEEICGKTLMGCGGQADEQNRLPQQRGAVGKHDRHDTDRTDKQGEFAGKIDCKPTLDEERGKPATSDTADIGNQIDDNEGQADLGQIQAMLVLEKTGHPKQIEPPDGIGQELGGDESPCLPVLQQTQPGHSCGYVLLAASNVGQFRGCAAGMFLGLAVNRLPEEKQQKAERPGQEKGPAPAEMNGDPGYEQGGQNRAQVAPRVKYSRGECAFLLREPLGDCLYTGRKNACFAETQRAAGEKETGQGTGKSVSHRGKTPKHHSAGVPQARAHAINESSNGQHANGIGALKGEDQVAVVDFSPAQIMLKSVLQDSEDLAVHIVLGYAKKKNSTDHPAVTSRDQLVPNGCEERATGSPVSASILFTFVLFGLMD